MATEGEMGDDARSRIVAAALELIAAGGADAATTRAVATAAAVQAPTLYRLFGDKDGLLDAVAEQAFATYVADKARLPPGDDPVDDLRRGWDGHVAFSLAHPDIFALMTRPRATLPSRAQAAGVDHLRERVRRVARAGRLRVTEERAVELIHAAGVGAIQALLRMPPDARTGFSDAAREAVLAAVLVEQSPIQTTGAASAASALRARLDDVPQLSPGERLWLDELLQRIAAGG